MSVSAGKLVTQANCCIINTPQSTLGLARLSGVLQAFATNWCVPCTACLPAAADNKGRWIFITQTCDFRYSDGTTWTNDFSSCTICCSNIWTWGTNVCGYLGDNTVTSRSSPVREISSSTDWCAIDTSLGSNNATVTNLPFVLALKSTGTLWAWGSGSCGVLGTNSTIFRSSPVQEVTSSKWSKIAAGAMHSLAIKTDGSLWGWGGNACGGQLGTNSTIFRSSPVQEVTASTNWCTIATGFHSSGIKTDGTLWLWGINACGQLGDNTTTARSSPVREISSSSNWCASNHQNRTTNALKTDGSLWSWGNNLCGVQANGDTLLRSSPVQEITCGTTWCRMSGKIGGLAAIKTDGSLWLWGQNDVGQLGDGTTTDRCSPVRELTSCNIWCQVSRGHHVGAITTANQLWLWGCNLCGQVGDNTTTNRSSPVREITSGSSWCCVTIGYPNNSSIGGAATIAIQSVFCKGFHSA